MQILKYTALLTVLHIHGYKSFVPTDIARKSEVHSEVQPLNLRLVSPKVGYTHITWC